MEEPAAFPVLRWGLKNCANSLYIYGVNCVFSVNDINNLAPQKTGCESCRPSQFQAESLIRAPALAPGKRPNAGEPTGLAVKHFHADGRWENARTLAQTCSCWSTGAAAGSQRSLCCFT
jgi:hypothetical protein